MAYSKRLTFYSRNNALCCGSSFVKGDFVVVIEKTFTRRERRRRRAVAVAVDERNRNKRRPKKKRIAIAFGATTGGASRFFSLSHNFFFFFFFLFFWSLSLSFSRARERERESQREKNKHKNFSSFSEKRLFDLRTKKYEHTPVLKRDTKERHVYIHTHTHFRRYARYETTLEMFARKSSVFVLLLFSVVLLLSVSFAARFGGFVQRRGKNENTSLTSHRRALLQRARCSNPWCFLISRRQRVKIRQCAVPQCARRVKPFSCSLEYCCASWCRNLPWEMLIQASASVSRLRDCVSTRVLRLV